MPGHTATCKSTAREIGPWVEAPGLLAGGGIERQHLPARCAGVEQPPDLQRRCLEVVLHTLLRQIAGPGDPRRLETRDIAGRDLR